MNKIVFICLNPSTADASVDDPTIRKCMKFAVREGFSVTGNKSADIEGSYRYSLRRGDLTVVNLFAWRATDPKELVVVRSPIGSRNFGALMLAREAALVIAAWGGKVPKMYLEHEGIVRGLLRGQITPTKLKCLKLNADGSPGHPLYLRDDSLLLRFTP